MALLVAHHLEETWDERSIPENQIDAKTLSTLIIEQLESGLQHVTQVIVTMTAQKLNRSVPITEQGTQPPQPEECHKLLIEFCEKQGIQLMFRSFDAGLDLTIDMTTYKKLHLSNYLAHKGHFDRIPKRLYAKLMSECDSMKGPLSTFTEMDREGLCSEVTQFLTSYTPPNKPLSEEDEGIVWAEVPFLGATNYTAIYPWMHNITKDFEVYICGAFDGECIWDLERGLTELGRPYTRIEELILADPEGAPTSF